jgi:hypothetical protein
MTIPVVGVNLSKSVLQLSVPDEPDGLGPSSKFGFKNPFQLFSLLPTFITRHPPHNRTVCRNIRVREFINNRIIKLWKTHHPSMGEIL